MKEFLRQRIFRLTKRETSEDSFCIISRAYAHHKHEVLTHVRFTLSTTRRKFIMTSSESVVSKRNIDTLSDAIEANDYDAIVMHDPRTLTHIQKHPDAVCSCGVPEPHAQTRLLSNLILSGPYGGWEGVTDARLDVIERLFQSGWLKADMLTDEDLVAVIMSNSGWQYNTKKLDILLAHVPKERWVHARNAEQQTCLHAVVFGHMSQAQETRHIKRFLAMGCDSLMKDKYCSIFCPVAATGNREVLEILLSNPGHDVHEQEWHDPEDPDHYNDKNNPIFCMLRRFEHCKDMERLSDIRACIKMLLAKGIDPMYVIPASTSDERRSGEGNTVYDYMTVFGWTEFLKDVLPIPDGYVSKSLTRGPWESRSWDTHDYSTERGIVAAMTEDASLDSSTRPADTQALAQLLLKLVDVQYSKDAKVISEWTQTILETFKSMPALFIKAHAFLHNSCECLYGFLYLKPIDEYYESIKRLTTK